MPEVGMTEKELQTAVIKLARMLGWRIAHFRPGKTKGGRWATQMSGDVGWPDLFLVRGDRVLAVELKSAIGKVSDEQREWLKALAQIPGIQTAVWRPEHLDDGTIQRTLGRTT